MSAAQVIERVLIRSAEASESYVAFAAERWDTREDDYHDYEGPYITVELSSPGLRAQATLPGYVVEPDAFSRFLRDLDHNWRGWDGSKTATLASWPRSSASLSPDGEGAGPYDEWMAVSALHDGRGHVALTIQVAEGWPMTPAWTARITLGVDIGSVREIADAIDRWARAVYGGDSVVPNS